MGVNIYIVDMRDNSNVAEWDSFRYGGDREVDSILHGVGSKTIPYGSRHMDCTYFERPNDVEAFRAALHAKFDFNSDRWDQMCDLLAEDENRGLYFSY